MLIPSRTLQRKEVLIDSLEKMQSKAVRFISNLKGRTSVTEAKALLGLITLENRRKKITVFLYLWEYYRTTSIAAHSHQGMMKLQIIVLPQQWWLALRAVAIQPQLALNKTLVWQFPPADNPWYEKYGLNSNQRYAVNKHFPLSRYTTTHRGI